AIGVGREDGGGSREREQFIPRADEDPSAFRALGPAEKIDHATLGFEIVEQQSHPLQVLDCLEIVEQVSRAAYDQLPLIRFPARPTRETGGGDTLGELTGFWLGLSTTHP